MSQENLPLLLKAAESAACALKSNPLPIDMSALQPIQKQAVKPEPSSKHNPRLLAVIVVICLLSLAIILFIPLTVIQRAVLALTAGIAVYILLSKKTV